MTTPEPWSQQAIAGLHHVAIAAHDVDAAARFYTAAAGFEAWPAGEALGLPLAGKALCSRNAGLWLLPAASAARPLRRPVNEAGIAHLCLQTTDIGQTITRFKASGASLHSEPIDLGTGYLYCYARDPEGNVIEVEGVAPVWPQARPWFAHANIVTPDLSRLVDFYSRFLGSEATRSPRLRNDPRLDTIADLQGVELRAAWLNAGNAQIELMQYLQPATALHSSRRDSGAVGFAHLGFEVTDLKAACARIVACGGQLQATPLPGAWQAQCLDPDGNRLLLLELAAPAQRSASIDSLQEPQITQRFAAARTAWMAAL